MSWRRGVILLAFGAVVVGVWLTVTARAVRTEYADAVRRDRWQQAVGLADRLAALGFPLPDNEQETLDGRLARLNQQVVVPLSTSATPEQVFERAVNLAQLDRFDDAEKLLTTIVNTRPGARLLLANVLQAAKRYDASDEQFRELIAEGKNWRGLSPRMPIVLAGVVGPAAAVTARRTLTDQATRSYTDLPQAYHGLAFNARQRGDTATALAVYAEARIELPQSAGEFWLDTGRTLVAVERNREAAAAFREAIRSGDRAVVETAREEFRRVSVRWGCWQSRP